MYNDKYLDYVLLLTSLNNLYVDLLICITKNSEN